MFDCKLSRDLPYLAIPIRERWGLNMGEFMRNQWHVSPHILQSEKRLQTATFQSGQAAVYNIYGTFAIIYTVLLAEHNQSVTKPSSAASKPYNRIMTFVCKKVAAGNICTMNNECKCYVISQCGIRNNTKCMEIICVGTLGPPT